MLESAKVSALHIANEAFLVASSIERCPKTMMIRELVMNALEAAADAEGEKRVEIRATSIDGVAKLCIWNTGPGLSASELHAICDLASSLHKTNALDRNFGMGAKVASLPSNRHGVRYRSCRGGVVSQAVLGQREGIYGRLLQQDESGTDATVIDVTSICRAENCDLSNDWTEVVLLGNTPGQNTVTDPYAGNPTMPPHWVLETLAKRFYRLPEAVALILWPEIAGGDTPKPFQAVGAHAGAFTRGETVPCVGGVRIHYGFSAPSLGGAPAASPGIGCIVHRDEVYGLRDAADWILDAPSFGIPFGAAHCTAVVELPDDYGVRPEVYRQFLRFKDGDQRQVVLADFAALVRTRMPHWLSKLIDSFGPPPVDYLAEVNDELRHLLRDLDIRPQFRGSARPRGLETPETQAEKPPLDPDRKPPKTYEVPPEMIALADPKLIEERGLLGRAAKYYPASHQLYLNVAYPAVARMAAQREQEFTGAPDPVFTARIARELSEWAFTRRVSRAAVYSLSKKAAGWTPQEIERAQSLESLSIAADDFGLQLGTVRLRMAEILGIPLHQRAGADSLAQMSWEARLAGESAEAEQLALRALSAPVVNQAPVLRRMSDIEMRKRNLPVALEWAQRALEINPEDHESHHQVARVLTLQGDLAGAEAATKAGLSLVRNEQTSRFLLQLSGIAGRRRDRAQALDLAGQAVEAHPADPWARSHLAALLLEQSDFAGAEQHISNAIECTPGNPAPFLRQMSLLENRRRNHEAAISWAVKAAEADPSSPDVQTLMVQLHLQSGDLDGAERIAQRALGMGSANPAGFFRQLADIEQRRKNFERAADFLQQAIDTDPYEISARMQMSGVLLQLDRMEEAEQAVAAAAALDLANPAPFLRRRAEIAERRRDLAQAIDLARQAVAADPAEAGSYALLSRLLMLSGEIEAAREAGLAAHTLQPDHAGFIRQLSAIESRRDFAAARAWAEKAVAADPTDPWSHNHLAGLLLQQGDLDAAEQAAMAALDSARGDQQYFATRVDDIKRRRAA